MRLRWPSTRVYPCERWSACVKRRVWLQFTEMYMGTMIVFVLWTVPLFYWVLHHRGVCPEAAMLIQRSGSSLLLDWNGPAESSAAAEAAAGTRLAEFPPSSRRSSGYSRVSIESVSTASESPPDERSRPAKSPSSPLRLRQRGRRVPSVNGSWMCWCCCMDMTFGELFVIFALATMPFYGLLIMIDSLKLVAMLISPIALPHACVSWALIWRSWLAIRRGNATAFAARDGTSALTGVESAFLEDKCTCAEQRTAFGAVSAYSVSSFELFDPYDNVVESL